MDKKQLMTEMGLVGEKIISNMLSLQGHKVEISINKFDSDKDLLIDGVYKAEVKTQVPFVMQNAFSIKPNQLRKCRTVDILYFICTPPPKHFDKFAGCIFSAEPMNFETTTYRTKDGRDMILIPREQSALKIIKKMTDDEINELKKYTVSDY